MTKEPSEYQWVTDQINAIIDAGGGRLTLPEKGYRTGVMRDRARLVAAKRGFLAKPTGDTLNVFPDPNATKATRGKPKSEMRQRIEDLKPGDFDVFETEPDGRQKLRALVQVVQRELVRNFTTQLVENGKAIMVTRVDSLHEASPDVRQHIKAEMRAKTDRWPFNRLLLGQSELVEGLERLENARSMAQYYKSKTGKAFRVEKTPNGPVITRIK